MRQFIVVFLLYLSIYTNVQSAVNETYVFVKSENLQQFSSVITGFTARLPAVNLAIFDMQGKSNEKKVRQFIQAKKPSIIIALGSLAASTVTKIEKQIPIVFAMVINYQKYSFLKQENVTGISMEVPSQKLFNQFKMLMPSIKSIGVPFHPLASAEIVNDALLVASKMDINLVDIEVTNPNEITAKLREKIDSYDSLWMLADTKLYNNKTNAINDLMSFSNRYDKPLLVFSESFLQAGAFFSITIDYQSLGIQTAFVANKIVEDKLSPTQIKIAPPIGIYRVVNEENAKLLEKEFSGYN